MPDTTRVGRALEPCIVQRVKCSELSESQKRRCKNLRFAIFLKKEIGGEFENLAPKQIKKLIVTDNTDYEMLSDWVSAFERSVASAPKPIESSRFATSSKLSSEIEIPPSTTSRGEHVSFGANIQSGVDGLFDLWVYHDIGVLDVDVKLAVGENPPPETLETLASTEAFWSRKFAFQNKQSEEVFAVDINIVPTAELQNAHYALTVLEGSEANPSVHRGSRRVSTRNVSEDVKTASQVSAYHEFGHTLGLGEEYDLEKHRRTSGHHLPLLGERHKEELLRETQESGSSPTSIMGKGGQLRARHYVPILKAFCDVIGSSMDEWDIVQS